MIPHWLTVYSFPDQKNSTAEDPGIVVGLSLGLRLGLQKQKKRPKKKKDHNQKNEKRPKTPCWLKNNPFFNVFWASTQIKFYIYVIFRVIISDYRTTDLTC